MKKLFIILIFVVILSACGFENQPNDYDIVATTLPVYDFTSALCEGTGLQIGRLVTESVSCLHDYTLQVSQMRMIEAADTVIISGAGLEEFLDDALHGVGSIIDASSHVHIHSSEHAEHGHQDEHEHHHDSDPHIWLSPENAKIMADNICQGLVVSYPHYEDIFINNLNTLHDELDKLLQYGNNELSDLSCRDLITFHDGFAYFAESFDLTILEAIEEESGSEASAAEIIHLVDLVQKHLLPAVFIEKSGSDACAGILVAETDVKLYTLDMAMAGNSYFDAMYHNIDTIKEALG